MSHKKPSNPRPFGELLGYAPGQVPVYSSNYDSLKPEDMPSREEFRHYQDGIYMGYKWQCVEMARRWLYINRGYVFEDIPMAYDIFEIKSFLTIDGSKLPAYSFRNGSRRKPEVGALLIWSPTGEFDRTGHVAVITEVLENSVRIVEQNVEHQGWGNLDWARALPLRENSRGGFTIDCTYEDTHILGWVIQTADNTHASRHKRVSKELFKLISSRINSLQSQWLDAADYVNQAYIKSMGGHKTSSDERNEGIYFCISKTAEEEIERATNELHVMFLKATDHVIRNPNLLQKFNFPDALIPRIEKSWRNRRNESLLGRFDFAMTEGGLKLYEYNVDSAGCYPEAGQILGQWAAAHGVTQGEDPGQNIFLDLTEAWGRIDSGGTVHILQDTENEETYMAEFMRMSIEASGRETRIIKGLNKGMRWDDAGAIQDAEGLAVKTVWKTWAWETAIDQMREREEGDQIRMLEGMVRARKPELVDVLLNSDVMVYEPLWSLIPSNKAILPVLWSLYPSNPYLLESQFELTARLKKMGYVKKPIVGRCGHNIEMVSDEHRTIQKTMGQFSKQDDIYQALFKLPKINSLYTQICSFTVNGNYSAICVRCDRSPIIQSASDILPLRVLSDEAFVGSLAG
jgi:glutathionylspermidine amidase/synthetase